MLGMVESWTEFGASSIRMFKICVPFQLLATHLEFLWVLNALHPCTFFFCEIQTICGEGRGDGGSYLVYRVFTHLGYRVMAL